MPIFRSFLNLFFRCDFHAANRRYWMYSIFPATFISLLLFSAPEISGSSCASTTHLTWDGLHHGFFSPQAVGFFHKKQEADHAQDHMSHNRPIISDLKVVEANTFSGDETKGATNGGQDLAPNTQIAPCSSHPIVADTTEGDGPGSSTFRSIAEPT